MNPASPPSPSQLPNRNEENLAPAEWRITTRREIAEKLVVKVLAGCPLGRIRRARHGSLEVAEIGLVRVVIGAAEDSLQLVGETFQRHFAGCLVSSRQNVFVRTMTTARIVGDALLYGFVALRRCSEQGFKVFQRFGRPQFVTIHRASLFRLHAALRNFRRGVPFGGGQFGLQTIGQQMTLHLRGTGC